MPRKQVKQGEGSVVKKTSVLPKARRSTCEGGGGVGGDTRRRVSGRARATADSDAEEFEVDAVLERKENRDGSTSYLVQWKGYGKDQATWELAANLNCPDLVRDFEDRHGNASEQEVFEVEAILDKKGDGDSTMFLIKWKGFSSDEATWQSADDVDCPDLIREFEELQAQKMKRAADINVLEKEGQVETALVIEEAMEKEGQIESKHGPDVRRPSEFVADVEEDPFAIEEVLAKEGRGESVRYLVKYKDFPAGEDTAWESSHRVDPDLIRRFEESQQAQGAARATAPGKRRRVRRATDESWEDEEADIASDGDDAAWSDDGKTTKSKTARKRTKTISDREKKKQKTTVDGKKKKTGPKGPVSDQEEKTGDGEKKKKPKGPAFELNRLYLSKKVAFSPAVESFMSHKIFAKVGSTFLVGVVCNYKYASKEGKYEVRWLNTYFNAHSVHIDLGAVIRGRENYERLQANGVTTKWTHIFGPSAKKETPTVLQIAENLDDLTEYEFSVAHVVPTTLAEVEDVMDVVFDPDERMRAPKGLFVRDDGTTRSQVKQESRPLFEHSASSSFFCVPSTLLLAASARRNERAGSASRGIQTKEERGN